MKEDGKVYTDTLFLQAVDKLVVVTAETVPVGTVLENAYTCVQTKKGRLFSMTCQFAAVQQMRAQEVLKNTTTELVGKSNDDLKTALQTAQPEWTDMCDAAETVSSRKNVWKKLKTKLVGKKDIEEPKLEKLKNVLRTIRESLNDRNGKKVAAALTIASVVAVGGVTISSQWPDQAQAVSVSTATEVLNSCTAPGITKPEQLGTLFASLNNEKFAGGDGTISVTLKDGRTLFLMADSLLNDAGKTQLHNTAVFLKDGCITGGDNNGEFLPTVRTIGTYSKFYWPSSAVVKETGEVVVFALVTTQEGGGMMGYKNHGMVRFTLRVDGTSLAVVSQETVSKEGEINWGTGLGQDKNGFVIYGTKQIPGQFGKDTYVARVDNIENPVSEYMVHSKTGWSKGGVPEVIAKDASTVVSPIPSNPYAYVTKADDALGVNVVLKTIDHKTGKLDSTTVLETAPSDQSTYRYSPEVHRVNGTYIVTINQIPTDGQISHSNYIPKTLSIASKKINQYVQQER